MSAAPMNDSDVVIVGSGPNGLAAAVILARAGLSVRLFEGNDTIGGGARTLELTEPGFRHDWGSAVHPMALASPFFRSFELAKRVELLVPEISYAQGLDSGQAGVAWRDIDRTAEGLGQDAARWRRLFGKLAQNPERLMEFALSPMLPVPRHPMLAAQFGARAVRHGLPALARHAFAGEKAAALLAGVMAHSIAPVPSLATAAPGLVLGALAHAGGWPIPRGGTQSITDALVRDFRHHGGVIETGRKISSLDELPAARAVLFDTAPRALLEIAGPQLHPRYRRALERWRHGNAASKVDFALSAPAPWTNPELRRAPTIHLGGTSAVVSAAERDVAAGRHPTSPYVLVSQPSVIDDSRAPAGQHTLWSYTHVPAGSNRDMTEAITAQIERFAPGFRDVIMASTATPATTIERGSPSFVGGDIANGAITLRQLIARPKLGSPWRAGVGLYLCSAASVPGPGVHGMGGLHAAQLVLREVFALPMPALGVQGDPAPTVSPADYD